MKKILAVLCLLAAPLLGQTPTPTPVPVGPPRYSLATQVRPGFGTFSTESTVNKPGDTYYAVDYRTFARVAPNTTATRKFWRQVSSGAPVWDTLVSGDIPALAYVTGITFSAPLTGGTITTSGTVGISSFASTHPSLGAVPDSTAAGAGTYLDKSGGWTVPSGTGATSPLTTKGDIWGYSSGDARLPVGANGKVLVADSSVALGVSYKGGKVQIAKITTAGSQATVDFTSIPADYSDLEVTYQARTNTAVLEEALILSINNDTTAGNYTTSQYIAGYSASALANTNTARTADFISGSTAVASRAGIGRILIPNYTATVFQKQVITNGYHYLGAGNAGTLQLGFTWINTAAITRLTFSNGSTFLNGSVFTLYGVGAP